MKTITYLLFLGIIVSCNNKTLDQTDQRMIEYCDLYINTYEEGNLHINKDQLLDKMKYVIEDNEYYVFQFTDLLPNGGNPAIAKLKMPEENTEPDIYFPNLLAGVTQTDLWSIYRRGDFELWKTEYEVRKDSAEYLIRSYSMNKCRKKDPKQPIQTVCDRVVVYNYIVKEE
ncbi:MAG: hypothetical protein K1X54_14695 [Flavobacteriales bacterium]|nr:hypothetical protein [Flavobacteriales bacterium]